MEIGCLAPHRILGHEGLGEIVAVGDQVRDFQVGEIVVVPL
ncbi:MAG: alcohol dehydrogenase catalytic domain-containing protein [Evtepia gabavorous]